MEVTKVARLSAEQRLMAAAVELATEGPLAAVTVSKVCRRAEVSRDSFYRFASSPAEMIARHLYEDHDVAQVVPRHGEDPGVRGLVPAMQLLVEHVQRNYAIYRNARAPHFPPVIQESLLRRFRQVLAGHVQEFPEKLPPVARSPAAIDAFVDYVAFATLGAVESLVGSGSILDTQFSVGILRAAIAPSWLAYD
ncbi:MAG: TetR/AcrR family transcriptional regulator [Actinobacteria bacterium]|nr:TetR/AcrR family transcriptional regulator [Actinomycetota bacterium]